ncbi:MAG: tetratricopeptide repeat protein [Pyrinomonadaceae bacterium]
MTQSRLEVFEMMTEQQPEDAMIWYGLASEYLKLERWADASNALGNVVRLNPDYTAAYQMLGTALMQSDAREAARRAWTQGIEAANRTGAWKARQHMEGLLAGINDSPDSSFCE